MMIHVAEHIADSKQIVRAALASCTRTEGSDKPIIYTVLRAVSRDYTKRDISIMVIAIERDRPTPINLSFHYCRIVGQKQKEVHGQWAVETIGVGMDMGYALAYDFARAAGIKDFKHEWL